MVDSQLLLEISLSDRKEIPSGLEMELNKEVTLLFSLYAMELYHFKRSVACALTDESIVISMST
jgi:hypothetical protein